MHLSDSSFGNSAVPEALKNRRVASKALPWLSTAMFTAGGGDRVQAVLSPVTLCFRQCSDAQAHQGFSFVFPSPCRHVQQPRDARTSAADFRKPSIDAEYDLCPLHAEHDANSCPEPGLCSTGKSVAVVCCCQTGHELSVRSLCCWSWTGSSCRHWSRVNTQFSCISQ